MHFDSHKTYFPTHKITCPGIITDLIVIKACKNIIIPILYKQTCKHYITYTSSSLKGSRVRLIALYVYLYIKII